MYTPTMRWAQLVGQTHTQYERVELLRPDGQVQMLLPVSSEDEGEAIEDATTTIRGYCHFDVIDPDGALTPRSNTDLLAPRGKKQIRIVRGVIDPVTGETAGEVPVGTYMLESVNRSRDKPGILEIEAYDRFIEAKRRSSSKLVLPNGITVTEGIVRVLQAIDPNMAFLPMETLFVQPGRTIDIGTDMAQEAVDMATSIGAEVFMNRTDLCIVQPIPIGNGVAVSTLSEEDGVVVVSDTNRWSAREVPNGYIVRAQQSGMPDPVIGEAWDENPHSPTYRYGDYGEVPADPIDTDRYSTVAQATAEARGRLTKVIGGDQEIEIEHSPNLALTTQDQVWLDLPSEGLAGLFTIRRISSPIGNPAAAQHTTVIRSTLALSSVDA